MALDPSRARDRQRRRQPRLQTYYGWDNLGDVHQTLTQLEQGDFRGAAIMTEAMFRDDRFYAVLRTRINALQSVPLDIKPASEKAKAVKIAELLGGTDDGPSEWDRMFSPPVVGELVKWGFCLGIGVGELVWTTDEGEIWIPDDESIWQPVAGAQSGEMIAPPRVKGAPSWKPRMRVWHPQFLRWDDARQRYILRQYDREVVLPDVHENPKSDGHWVLWCPYGYHGAWLQGLVRALGVTVLDRTWNRHDWSRFNEKYGKPIEKAIVPQGADQTKKDAHFDGIANRAGESVVMCEQGTDEAGKPVGFDVALVESKSTGWDTFQARKKENDADIAIVGLGQSMTTETPEGKGSMATDASNAVRRDYLKTDAGVMVCLRDQGLTHYTRVNHGDDALTPMPQYRVDPPEDKAAKATAQAGTATALATLKTAGAPIDERAMLEDADIPTITEEEHAANQAIADEKAAAIAGGNGPDGGDDPDGDGGGQFGGPKKDPPSDEDKKTALAAKKPPKIAKRYLFQGLPIAIENEKGSTREWPGGSTRMQHDYGFIEGHMAWDDDEVDVYVGPNDKAPDVHVVHQLAAPTYDRYDEDKVMLGFDTHDAAKRAYLAHRNDGDRAIKSITSMPVAEFHRKLRVRKGAGPIRASALIDARLATLRALMALAARTQRDVTKLRAQGKQGTRYADRLVENATRVAARALAGDLVGVKSEIAQASDFKDLEARLLRRFKDMDPTRLAAVIEKARIMGNLSGQLSARKEIKKK